MTILDQVLEQTTQLKIHLDRLKDVFENNISPKDFNDREYFFKMKEETLTIYQVLDPWEEDALDLVKERKINVHPHQITSTRENIELIIPHSYYKDIRRRRYMEYYNSCHYVLNQILNGIK